MGLVRCMADDAYWSDRIFGRFIVALTECKNRSIFALNSLDLYPIDRSTPFLDRRDSGRQCSPPPLPPVSRSAWTLLELLMTPLPVLCASGYAQQLPYRIAFKSIFKPFTHAFTFDFMEAVAKS